MRELVLIVDDVEINRIILREIISDDYDVMEAQDGIEAVDLLFNQKISPTAILLDIIMPKMNGFEVLERVRGDARTENIPVIFITSVDSTADETQGFRLGVSDYITKPFNADIVKVRLETQIKLFRYQTGLEEIIEEKTAELNKTYERTLETLATIIEYRNLESGTHIRRTSLLTEIMIRAMMQDEYYKEALKKEKIHSLIKSTVLHDIGKIGVMDSILLKPGRLTDDEFEQVKTHTTMGHEIIQRISTQMSDDDMYLKYGSDICYAHHERWDGRGYPQGLAGEDIPIAARILSIVDVYDALVNERCYKPPMSYDEAKQLILDGAGTQFDPGLCRIFDQVSDRFMALEEQFKAEEAAEKESGEKTE